MAIDTVRGSAYYGCDVNVRPELTAVIDTREEILDPCSTKIHYVDHLKKCLKCFTLQQSLCADLCIRLSLFFIASRRSTARLVQGYCGRRRAHCTVPW
jgi:hypothetical protein